MMNPIDPVEQAATAPRVRVALQGWKTSAVTAAVAAMLCCPAQDAYALALGRITVLSALGEPLRAEIELADINAEESSTLRTTVAAPAAFRAAGLEYNAALADVQIVQRRRADGRTVLDVTSVRAVNDPFVDLILQVNWASGRIVRDYTILLDPPALRQPSAVTTATPQVPNTAPQITPAPPVTAPSFAPPPAAANSAAPGRPIAAARVRAPSQSQTPPPSLATSAAGPSSGQTVVKTGDTAGRIAAASKPASVSLDQMLVAMLRANPQAFVQGNVNRIKAGAVVQLPTPEQAAATPAAEASQTILAQSRDFNGFRGKLAGSVPTVEIAGAERNASGRVQAQVDENKPSAAAPDKLTLSKGSVQSKAAEDRIAREKAAKDASERVAELSKNISDLNKLGTAGAPAVVAAAPEAVPTSPKAAPLSAVPATPPPAVSASAPAQPANVAPAEKAGWIHSFLENPLIPGLAAALVLLLAGFGFYRSRQRKKAAQAENSLLDSRMQPDSFFGASGGQRIDTAEAGEPASSMSYSPSQLDAAGDVDPVAEADVYLAYGRDLQAEEILKEALRMSPTRVAIYTKLADIYAKRRDLKGFQGLATKVHELTEGVGPEWTHMVELGRELDPTNPLWGSELGAAPAATATAIAAAAGTTAVAAAAGISTPTVLPPAAELSLPVTESPALDLDLDLDVTADEAAASSQNSAVPQPSRDLPFLDHAELDRAGATTQGFGVGPAAVEPLVAAAAESAPSALMAHTLDFDIDLGPDTPPPLSPTALTDSRPVENDSGLMDFDLGSLTLDLGDSTSGEPPIRTAEVSTEDPLATKLALAEEFNAIGDAEGARALAEEVLAEASGSLKSRAERFLSELG